MKNSIIEKIKKMKKNGILFQQIIRKIHSFFPLYFLKSKNLIFSSYMWKYYKKFQKKYKNIIQEEIVVTERKKSNKIWICWFQGFDFAPEIVKICYNSVKKNMPNHEIILLTDENIEKYIDFPDFIKKKRKEGRISDAQYSDLIRIDLLSRYGGGWLDATVFLSTHNIPSYITESDLFVYKKIDLLRLDKENTIVCSNWLIFASSNSKILLLTRKLLWKYWEDYNNLKHYFIFHIFMSLASQRYKEEWEKIPTFNNETPHIMEIELENVFSEERWQQLKDMSVFHKLKRYKEYSIEKNTIYKYIKESYNKGE